MELFQLRGIFPQPTHCGEMRRHSRVVTTADETYRYGVQNDELFAPATEESSEINVSYTVTDSFMDKCGLVIDVTGYIDENFEEKGLDYYSEEERQEVPPDEVKKAIKKTNEMFEEEDLEEIRYKPNEDFPNSIEIILKGDSKKAFKSFIQILEEIDFKDMNVTPFLGWSGKNDLKPEEISNYILEIIEKSGTEVKSRKRLNATKLVREMREE